MDARFYVAPSGTYRPGRPLARIAMTLVVAVPVTQVVGLIASNAAGVLAALGIASVQQLLDLLLIQALLRVSVLLVSAAAFLAWLRRAFDNLPALGAGPRASSGTILVPWFVPLWSLVAGYLVVGDLWARTATRDTELRLDTIRLWWACWLGALFLELPLGFLAASAPRAVLPIFGLVPILVLFVSAGALVSIIREVERRTTVRAAAMATAAAWATTYGDMDSLDGQIPIPPPPPGVLTFEADWAPDGPGEGAAPQLVCPRCGMDWLTDGDTCIACGNRVQPSTQSELLV